MVVAKFDPYFPIIRDITFSKIFNITGEGVILKDNLQVISSRYAMFCLGMHVCHVCMYGQIQGIHHVITDRQDNIDFFQLQLLMQGLKLAHAYSVVRKLQFLLLPVWCNT